MCEIGTDKCTCPNCPDACEIAQDKERWEAAIEHAREMLEEYKKIPAGFFGAAIISANIALYEAGDRSEELLESLEGIE